MQARHLNKYLAIVFLFVPLFAHAHPGHASAMNFWTGLAHPVLGWDHLLAMLAVGAWAAQAAGRRAWIAPGLFLSFLTVGALFGINGTALPGMEQGIALSLLVLGLLLGWNGSTKAWPAYLLIGAFAFFHGYAHGIEGAAGNALIPYFLGFILTTILLHGGGFATGLALAGWHRQALQGAGVLLACVGSWLLLHVA
jgi:urease accessory protein